MPDELISSVVKSDTAALPPTEQAHEHTPEESNIAPEDRAAPVEPPVTDKVESDTSKKSVPDTLTIADHNRVIKWEKDGEVFEVPFHQILGGTQLKKKHDEWVESVQKPFEESVRKWENLNNWWREDPSDFLVNNMVHAVQSQAVTADELTFSLSQLSQLAQAYGIPVKLVDADTGKDFSARKPQPRPQAQPQESRFDKAQNDRQIAEVEFRAVKAETLLQMQKRPSAAVIQRADELYRGYHQYLSDRNPDNPYHEALLLATLEAQEAATVTKQTPRRPEPGAPKQPAKSQADELNSRYRVVRPQA